MDNQLYAFSDCIEPDQVKAFRRRLKMTQPQFARLMGVSPKTIQKWEYGDHEITGPAVMLIRLLEEDPDRLKLFEVPDKTYPLRLWYMYKHDPCTVIDVDEGNQRVRIKNFTTRVQFRAFGNNPEPSYADYEHFLESRCFPRSRDKMKLMLRELGIPFYDPMLIISKTQGRMAEDDFWIKVEL